MNGFPLGASVTLDELTHDPHPTLARLRSTEPVSWVPVLDAWLVTTYADADRVLRDPRTFTVDDPRFSTAQVIGPSMLSLDGSAHSRHRAPFTGPFKPAAVHAQFATFVADLTSRLLDGLGSRGAADLRPTLAGPLAIGAVARALGLRGVDDTQVLAWYAAIVDSVDRITAGERASARGATAYAELHRHVAHTVNQGDATESLLQNAAAAGDLSVDEVVANAAVLMFGGIDTTESAILSTLWLLMGNPDVEAEVRSEPGLVPALSEESFRLEPAAMVVDRYATVDVDLGVAQVRAGDKVVVSLAGANRDPAVFVEPDRLDLRRDNARQHLGFARGPHFCLGVDLARLERAVAVELVLDRLRGVRLDPDRPVRPAGLVFRKLPALPVVWDA